MLGRNRFHREQGRPSSKESLQLPPPKKNEASLVKAHSVIEQNAGDSALSAISAISAISATSAMSTMARLGLEPWADKLAEQEMDLQALALVEAGDLNRQLGIPLGRAAKAIHEARQLLELLEDNMSSAGGSDTHNNNNNNKNKNTGMATATLGRSSWSGRLQANVPLAALVKNAWELRRAFGPLDLVFFFVDHQVRWKKSLCAHRDGIHVKDGMTNVGIMWATNMSLWLGVVTSLMGTEHQGVPPWMLLAYEALLSLDATVLLTCLMAWVVVAVCLTGVHDSQVHNFMAAAEAPLQVCELLLLMSIHLTILGVFCEGQLRLWFTDWGPYSNSTFHFYLTIVVAAMSMVVILLCASCAFVMSNLVYHGGLMAPGDLGVSRANRSAASAAVWQYVRERWT